MLLLLLCRHHRKHCAVEFVVTEVRANTMEPNAVTVAPVSSSEAYEKVLSTCVSVSVDSKIRYDEAFKKKSK